MYKFARSIIAISGDDSFKFLQNLITNDLKLLSNPNHIIYAMILSPHGRFLFDLFISKPEENRFFLEVSEATKDILLKRLNLYKINLSIQIENMSDLKVSYSAYIIDNVIGCFKDPRFEKLGYRIIDLKSYDSSVYLEHKYKFGIPDSDCDFIFDKSIPLEYGAEELGAVSYTKGCYIGQELTSRTKSQGVVRKKLYLIETSDDCSNISNSQNIISEDGIVIGKFCSGKKDSGIALLKEELVNNSKLHIEHSGCFVISSEIAPFY